MSMNWMSQDSFEICITTWHAHTKACALLVLSWECGECRKKNVGLIAVVNPCQTK